MIPTGPKGAAISTTSAPSANTAPSGIPVLASNRAHEGFLDADAFFDRDDDAGLADRLSAIAAQSPAERDETGRRLRERVQRENSVDSWAAGLLKAAGINTA